MNEFLKTIDELVKTLAANPYIGLGGFLIGIISLLFSYYVAKRDRRIKNLSHILVSNNIISKSQAIFPKLVITYDGENLENLTVSKVRISNPGTETITSDDVANNDPLRFSIKPEAAAKMLDFGITYVSDPHNNFRLKKVDENTIEVNFDFIEPKDTLLFEILHTGKDTDVVKVDGTIIGAKNKFSKRTELDIDRSTTSKYRAIRFALVLASVLGISSIIFFFLLKSYILGAMCLLPAIFFIYASIKIATSKVNPSSTLLTTALTSSMRKTLAQIDSEISDTTKWDNEGE